MPKVTVPPPEPNAEDSGGEKAAGSTSRGNVLGGGSSPGCHGRWTVVVTHRASVVGRENAL